MTTTNTLPHWQLTSIFSAIDGEDFQQAQATFKQKLEHFEQRTQTPIPAEDFATFLPEFSSFISEFATLRGYLSLTISTDAFNEEAKAALSHLQPFSSRVQLLAKKLSSMLKGQDIAALVAGDAWLEQHQYVLEMWQENANHLLSDESEYIITKMSETGGNAWGKLQGELISKSTIHATINGEEKDWSVSELSNLRSHAERAVRHAAFSHEDTLLQQNSISYSAALNNIKGQHIELCKSRGWSSPLEESLHRSHISAQSLEAMHEAVRESLPDFQQYYRNKAQLLGLDSLTWYDLRAPISRADAPAKHYSWQEAKDFVVEQFASYSQGLADFAQRSFDENWHDVPPRKGKRNGAFCSGVANRQESRIMLNFGHTLDDIFTVAHELGHAYHNDCCYRFDTSVLQRSNTPMTLAETASIFCETIVINAMLEQASPEDKLVILAQDLLSSAGITVDIYSRFLFESSVFEKRQARELSTQEINDLMLEAQQASYGDALSLYHPRQWMQKPHYYSFGMHYYNYPYTFGYLFGLGVFAQYQQDPEGFKQRYDRLLASTGNADAKTLAKDFAIDIEDIAFWRSSLAVAKARGETFAQLVSQA